MFKNETVWAVNQSIYLSNRVESLSIFFFIVAQFGSHVVVWLWLCNYYLHHVDYSIAVVKYLQVQFHCLTSEWCLQREHLPKKFSGIVQIHWKKKKEKDFVNLVWLDFMMDIIETFMLARRSKCLIDTLSDIVSSLTV